MLARTIRQQKETKGRQTGNEEIKLYEYEYLLKTPGFSNITIALLVKYDVIKMINKSDWNMKDVTDIFIK